ncbi:MAG: DNA-processing protein DprA [Kangiellaceae bacterium]
MSAHHGLDDNQLRKLFAIKKIKGVGDVNALKLFNHFQSAEAVFAASDDQLKQIGLKASSLESIRNMDFYQFDSTFRWLEHSNSSVIPINSTYYPPLLLQTATPPLYLFTIGNYELLLNPQIAVVGSRSPTPVGSNNTHQFCKELINQGLAITSGLAQGVDGDAHRAALECGGYTIAVSGTGLKTVFPAPHKNLAHEIANRGLLISENLPDQGVVAGCFPRRNRIIAGLSLGTLVVEAAEKSGSLITAKIAMDESREVFAIPGSIHNPLAKGCHALIKQGAKLVEKVEDIMEELPAIAGAQKIATTTETRPALNVESAEFLKFIDYEITSLDTILNRSQLSIESVTNKLLLLELDGWIINSAGGYTRL